MATRFLRCGWNSLITVRRLAATAGLVINKVSGRFSFRQG